MIYTDMSAFQIKLLSGRNKTFHYLINSSDRNQPTNSVCMVCVGPQTQFNIHSILSFCDISYGHGPLTDTKTH